MTDFVAGQIPWLATPFQINYNAVRMLYLDSLNGHFYIGGNIRMVDSMDAHWMFRIDSNEVVNLLDTIPAGADPPLAMIRYKDTLYQAGYYGLFTYMDSMFTHVRPSCQILGMTIYKGDLLISGCSDLIPDSGTIIKYDGNKFSPYYDVYDALGGNQNLQPIVGPMCEYKSRLYVGGNFSGYNGFGEVASWDGNEWDNMGGEYSPTEG